MLLICYIFICITTTVLDLFYFKFWLRCSSEIKKKNGCIFLPGRNMNGRIVQEKFFAILGLIYWSCAAMDLIVFRFIKAYLDYQRRKIT